MQTKTITLFSFSLKAVETANLYQLEKIFMTVLVFRKKQREKTLA